MRKVTHYDIGKIQHSCGSSHGESTTDLLAVSCVACLETMGGILQDSLAAMNNKLNLDSQNFQIECQKAEIKQLRAKLATLQKVVDAVGKLHGLYKINRSCDSNHETMACELLALLGVFQCFESLAALDAGMNHAYH